MAKQEHLQLLPSPGWDPKAMGEEKQPARRPPGEQESGGPSRARARDRSGGGRQEDMGSAGQQGGPRARPRGESGHQEDRRHAGRQGGPRARPGDEAGRQEDRQPQRSIIQPDRLPCRFDGRCERIPNCPYIHSMEDFPPLQRREKPVRRMNQNQRRN